MMNSNCNQKCSECPNGILVPDPDPFDWFCDDDEKIVCELNGETIAEGLRPYEADDFIPAYEVCPLNKMKGKK